MKPCKNCPFRNDGYGVFLRQGRATEIAKEILDDKYFPCHKHVYAGATNPICRGALTMLEKQGVDVFKVNHVRMAAGMGLWEPNSNHDLVWDSLFQMEENAL